MRDRCNSCKKFEHCGGTGTYELFDQDGLNKYVCQCHCGYQRKQLESAKYEIGPLVRRYGKDLLLAILND